MNAKPNVWLRFLKWSFTLAAIIVLAVAVYRNRDTLSATLADANLTFLSAAIVVYMLAHLVGARFTSVMLTGMGSHVRYHEGLDLHIRYLPARYVPGGIWHALGRAHGLHQLGVGGKRIAGYFAIENSVAVSVALALGGYAIGFIRNSDLLGWFTIGVALACTGFLALIPILANRWGGRRNFLGNPPAYLEALLVSVGFWLLAAAAFLLFILALPSAFPVEHWLEIAGIYLFSWGIGFLAVFAPQGIGVFEFVAAELLPGAFPFSATIAILAGFRVLVMLADLGTWALWLVFKVFRATLGKQMWRG